MRLAALAMIGAVVVAPGRHGCGSDPVAVHWAVPDGPGTRGVDLVGCLDWRVASFEAAAEGGGRADVVPGWTACGVQGWRQDGALRVVGPVVPIDGGAPSQVLDLGLPWGPIGGIGARIYADGRGIRIDQVVPGGPADQAGLAPGDRITEVGGQPTWGLTTTEFVRASTGEPGTDVELAVRPRGGDGEREVTLSRTRIPADWRSRTPCGGW
ncbi:MAG: PDZ domain-containing protein [Myxococcota bacterium]